MGKTKHSKERKFAYYDTDTVRVGIVPETDRTPQVNYTFRPPGAALNAMLDSALVAEESPEAVTEAMLQVVTRCVVTWDLRKPDRKNPSNAEGLPVDPTDIEELKLVDDFIIDSVVKEIKRKPVILKAK